MNLKSVSFKNIVLGIGIVIIYGLMLWQGIEAFYPSPQYETFCNSRTYSFPDKPIPAGVNCTFSPSPQQQDQCIQASGSLIAQTYDSNGCPLTYTCDFCNRDLTNAQKEHSKIVFFISLIVGIITLLIGYTVLSVEPVGSALMASGVWAIFYGTAWNWANLSSIWRFLLLALALVLVVWIALRLNKPGKKGFFGFGKRKK